jgi:hypothetical protein
MEQPISTQPNISQTSTLPTPKKSFTWLLALILLLLLAVIGFFAWDIYRIKNQSIPVQSSLSDLIAGWEIYTDPSALYQIQYPGDWQTESQPSGIGFGPKEIDDGTIWSILAYNKEAYPKDRLIEKIDEQLPGRVQTTETISINGVSADKVITTSPEKSFWYSETIIIEVGKNNIVISNGGLKDEELNTIIGGTGDTTFKKFYSSFKVLN